MERSEKKAPSSARKSRPTNSVSQAPGGHSGQIGQTKNRTLTLKQLKDTIADMYAQKVKFDKKCQENKVPRETMEQFMYTYLN